MHTIHKNQLIMPPLGKRQVLRHTDYVIEYFDGGTGTVIVLLPALGGSAADFGPLIQGLQSNGCRTLCMQLPGVGESNAMHARSASLITYANAVASMLHHAGIEHPARVHVLGRALGNRVARIFATLYPERVDRLILLSAGGHYRANPGWARTAAYLSLLIPGLPLRLRRRLYGFVLRTNSKHLPDTFCRTIRARTILGQIKAIRNTEGVDWLLGGAASMLVIHGELDPIAAVKNAHELKRQAPERVELLLLPEGGHAFVFDHLDLVVRRTIAFIRKADEDPR